MSKRPRSVGDLSSIGAGVHTSMDRGWAHATTKQLVKWRGQGMDNQRGVHKLMGAQIGQLWGNDSTTEGCRNSARAALHHKAASQS